MGSWGEVFHPNNQWSDMGPYLELVFFWAHFVGPLFFKQGSKIVLKTQLKRTLTLCLKDYSFKFQMYFGWDHCEKTEHLPKQVLKSPQKSG